MTVAIPDNRGLTILSMEYDPTGLSWVRLYDNSCLGWLVDETTVENPPVVVTEADPRVPQVTGAHIPVPIILGSLAKPAPPTAPIVSPQWGTFTDPTVFVPDLLRMLFPDFLTWLATNGGAHRVIGTMIGLDRVLLNAYKNWAANNPTLAFEGDPPGAM